MEPFYVTHLIRTKYQNLVNVTHKWFNFLFSFFLFPSAYLHFLTFKANGIIITNQRKGQLQKPQGGPPTPPRTTCSCFLLPALTPQGPRRENFRTSVAFAPEVPALFLVLDPLWAQIKPYLASPGPQESPGLGFGWLSRDPSSLLGKMVLSSCNTGQAAEEINRISAQRVDNYK